MSPNAAARAQGPEVAIVGGGVTGAAVALHLAMARRPPGLAISVIEPRPSLGSGLAYASEEPSHRVNVPALRMSLMPGDAGHFERWLLASGELERDVEATWQNGDAYPRRGVFGRYVAEQLEPHVAGGLVRHVQDKAISIRANPQGSGWTIETTKGPPIRADIVVLAVTHPAPAVPAAIAPLVGQDGFIADPYEPDALSVIRPDASVLIVGSGLTSADMVAELDRRGHRGVIVSVSRNGLLSRGHPAVRGEPFGDFASAPATTALGLLRNIRATLAAAAASNITWHSVFDRLRAQASAIWSALPPDERTKLVRQLRVFWDVHRFRMAPQVAAVLERREQAGTFLNFAARLIGSRMYDGRFEVEFRRRGRAEPETMLFDGAINATGPAHRAASNLNAALRTLADAGLVQPDRYGLGIQTSAESRAVCSDGSAVSTLFVAGPLARGTFGELMGLPEVASHAKLVAVEIQRVLHAQLPPELRRQASPRRDGLGGEASRLIRSI
jgi:uncharacterized NAD(P)/FAD-binding protein YdhS